MASTPYFGHITFDANTQKYDLKQDLWGFSGYKHRHVRQRLIDSGMVVRIFHPDATILIYQNPVVGDYHLPQDSVGIHIDDRTIYFGIADGVSIVGHTMDNNSGYLSYILVNSLPDLKEKPWEEVLNNTCNSFQRAHHIGSSTVIWGSLVPKETEYELSALTVAETFDSGTFRVFSKNGSIEFSNHSQGFVPNNYQYDKFTEKLPKRFDLFVASDGVNLDSHDLTDLINLNRGLKTPIEEFTLFLEREIQPNRDDQSFILISTDI
ncbi:hypothetical protein HGA91_06000 [candidate division WWE3 bacterium]|nr:hypothetical protein [candidate division WWE3 bacterium]